nr:immunoglobulin heavy chain junction region [Macaca mulatta]
CVGMFGLSRCDYW